jgi:hypothetical protein
MYNAWGKRPLEYPGKICYFGGYCNSKGTCFLRRLFGDGALGYAADWVVINGIFTRTAISGDSDINELFTKNIDPLPF